MMAIEDPDQQVELLSKVLNVFQTADIVKAFKNADSEDTLFALAQKHIG